MRGVWGHAIEFLGYAEPDADAQALDKGVALGQNVFCSGGEGHEAAENCGGEAGWERTKWRLAERGVLDPWYWDIVSINRRLDHMWVDVSPVILARIPRELIRNDVWSLTRTTALGESRERMRAFAQDPELLHRQRTDTTA